MDVVYNIFYEYWVNDCIWYNYSCTHTTISGIVLTVGTFEAAKRKPDLFRLRTDGYHSVSRSRQYMWVNGQKVQLDARDPGGEHE